MFIALTNLRSRSSSGKRKQPSSYTVKSTDSELEEEKDVQLAYQEDVLVPKQDQKVPYKCHDVGNWYPNILTERTSINVDIGVLVLCS